MTATEALSELGDCEQILARELHYALGEESPAFFLEPIPCGAGNHLPAYAVSEVAVGNAQAVFCVSV